MPHVRDRVQAAACGNVRLPTPPLWLLVLVTISASISMHLFIPALPMAAAEFGVGASQMQMSISLYLLGLAGGHLFWGPLSDARGRRTVLLAGLAMFAVGGIAAACAPDLRTLLAARLLQAIGASSGMSLGRAIIRDTTGGEDLVRRLALLSLMVVLSPGLAPMVGGAVAGSLGWRYVFVLLAALGVAAFWIAWQRLPETHHARTPVSARVVISNYKELLRSAEFIGTVVGAGALTTSVFAFLTAAPFILMQQLQQPLMAVGLYSGLVMMGVAAGNAVAGTLARRVGSKALLLTGLASAVAGSASLLLLVLLQRLELAGLLLAVTAITCGIGLAAPPLMARTISMRPALAGSAAGLYGCSQMVMGTVSTSLVGLDDDPALGCAKVLLGMSLLASTCVAVALRCAHSHPSTTRGDYS